MVSVFPFHCALLIQLFVCSKPSTILVFVSLGVFPLFQFLSLVTETVLFKNYSMSKGLKK